MYKIRAVILPMKIFLFGGVSRLLSNIKSLVTGAKPPLSAAGLTVLCPIVNSGDGQLSNAMLTSRYLHTMGLHNNSPMAKVPNTYLCRFYVLNDVFYEGYPATEEHLKSKYLVFSTNYYGSLETYLENMWHCAEDDVKAIWQHCVAFDKVSSAVDFGKYMKKCQIKDNLFFNGSTATPLDEQLKSLYLKQEFSRFVYQNQGKNSQELQQAFQAFIARTQPDDLNAPTWIAGADEELIKSQG